MKFSNTIILLETPINSLDAGTVFPGQASDKSQYLTDVHQTEVRLKRDRDDTETLDRTEMRPRRSSSVNFFHLVK